MSSAAVILTNEVFPEFVVAVVEIVNLLDVQLNLRASAFPASTKSPFCLIPFQAVPLAPVIASSVEAVTQFA